MITVKNANNTLTNIAEADVKTSANALTKIAEGYQVVSVNGEKRLIPVFLSECKHNYEWVDSVGGSCTEEGWVKYRCSVCGDTYTESTGTDPTAHWYDSDTGVCNGCGETCGHFSVSTEELEQYWVDETGCCTTCGFRVWA